MRTAGALGIAGLLLATLALGACGRNENGNPTSDRVAAGSSGSGTSGAAPQAGAGLNGGLGTGAASSAPATGSATTSAPTGSGTGGAVGADGSSQTTSRGQVGSR